MYWLVGKDREVESPNIFTLKLFLIPIVWEKEASVVCVSVCGGVFVCVIAGPGPGDPV